MDAMTIIIMIKNFLLKICLSIFLVLTPIKFNIIAIGTLVFIDLVFSIMASLKKKEIFSSSRLKDSVVKLLVYNLLLIAGFVSESYISDWIPFTKIILSFISIVEITSLGESFQIITGKKLLPFIKKYINDKLNEGKKENKK